MKHDCMTVEKAINGDVEAFEECIAAEKQRLFYKALSYVGNKEDASDAVQETLYKAFLSIGQLQNPQYFSTWLFKILIRECYRLQKKRNRLIPFDDDEIIRRLEQPSEEEKNDHVSDALSKLTLPQRSAIVLFYYYSFPIREIADMMKKPEGTVKTLLHRARKTMKTHLTAVMNKNMNVTEVIYLVKEELEKIARSLVQVPQDFRKVIENYEEDEAYFSWMEEEKGIIGVKLDTEGRLTYLTIDMQKEDQNTAPSLSVEEKQAIAERYLLQHYPDALQHFTYHHVKELKECNAARFYFEQLVMGIPLSAAGSYIDVNNNGEVILFNYKGVKAVPPIPKQLILKENLTEHVLDQLYFELVADQMHAEIHNVEEDSLRLVYLPNLVPMKYRAADMNPESAIEQDEKIREVTRPLPSLDLNVQTERPVEEIIGITDTMEKLREVDWGEEIGIVWRERGWNFTNEDLSFESYLKERTEQTVKAFISKETGRARSFMWFQKRTGSLQLGHEACFEKALHFLQLVIPELLPYVQYIIPQNEEEVRENETKEFFMFRLYNDHGIPVHSEVINIAVNKETGQIDHYSGPRITVQQLKELPHEPVLSPEQAFEKFKEHLDFQLAWEKDYVEEEEVYELVYKACDRYTKTAIRAIDAVTGEVICNKE